MNIFDSILSSIIQQIFLKVAEDSGVDSVELSGEIQTLILLIRFAKVALKCLAFTLKKINKYKTNVR